MKFYVGVTDNKWFEFLASRKPDEVNFWGKKTVSGTDIAQIAAEIESGRKQLWMIAWRQIGSNA